MPDLSGLSARHAVEILGALGMHARIDGDGFVVDQSPPHGVPVERGAHAQLTLALHSPDSSESAQ